MTATVARWVPDPPPNPAETLEPTVATTDSKSSLPGNELMCSSIRRTMLSVRSTLVARGASICT